MPIWEFMFIWTKSRKAMKWYSRSREDFRDLIFNKYKMREAIYVEWDSCSKCYLMKPHAKKRADDNWYEFQTFRFDDASVKEFNIQSVPMLILKEDWVVKEILDMDGIVSLISNQNK
jgi:hypothetical protein